MIVVIRKGFPLYIFIIYHLGLFQQSLVRYIQTSRTYCPFHVLVQANFHKYYFNFLPNQAQTQPDHWKVLDKHCARFHSNPTTGKELPYRPPLWKLPAFGNVITLQKADKFYNGGLWGYYSSVVKFSCKFCLRVRLQRWNDRAEFELDRAKSNNNIAENSIAPRHDTHNSIISEFFRSLPTFFWTANAVESGCSYTKARLSLQYIL